MSRGDFIDSRQDLGCSKDTYILHRMGMKVSYVSSWIFCFVIFSFEPRPGVVHGRRVDKFANFTFKFAAIVPILLRQEICFLLPYYFVFLIFFVLYLSKIVLSQKKFFASSLYCWPKPDISESRRTISNLFHNTRGKKNPHESGGWFTVLFIIRSATLLAVKTERAKGYLQALISWPFSASTVICDDVASSVVFSFPASD